MLYPVLNNELYREYAVRFWNANVVTYVKSILLLPLLLLLLLLLYMFRIRWYQHSHAKKKIHTIQCIYNILHIYFICNDICFVLDSMSLSVTLTISLTFCRSLREFCFVIASKSVYHMRVYTDWLFTTLYTVLCIMFSFSNGTNALAHT